MNLESKEKTQREEWTSLIEKYDSSMRLLNAEKRAHYHAASVLKSEQEAFDHEATILDTKQQAFDKRAKNFESVLKSMAAMKSDSGLFLLYAFYFKKRDYMMLISV